MYSSFAPDRVFRVEQRTFNGKKIPKQKQPVTFAEDDYKDKTEKVVFHTFENKTRETAQSFRQTSHTTFNTQGNTAENTPKQSARNQPVESLSTKILIKPNEHNLFRRV